MEWIDVISTYQLILCKEKLSKGGKNCSLGRTEYSQVNDCLLRELVQPLLDYCNSQTSSRTKRPSSGADSLKGKCFQLSKHLICRCCAVCVYVQRADSTQSRNKTSSYCSKCEEFICKKCFEKYHTKSNAK